jgi:GNAT superfamily N-acetyltransferase
VQPQRLGDDEIEFVSLHDHPELIPLIARWNVEAFSHISGCATEPATVEADIQRKLAAAYGGNGFPYKAVARRRGQPVGTANLKVHNVTSGVLAPCFDGSCCTPPPTALVGGVGGVVVAPAARGAGVARALVEHLEEQARHRGLDGYLYLETEALDGGLYARHCGWEPWQRIRDRGDKVLVMRKHLNQGGGSACRDEVGGSAVVRDTQQQPSTDLDSEGSR